MIETTHRSYGRTFFKYTAITFSIGFVCSIITTLFFMPIKQSIIVSFISSSMISLFVATGIHRNLKDDAFIIDPSTKDRDIGLEEYHQEIVQFLRNLNYHQDFNQNGLTIFNPGPFSRSMGGTIFVRREALIIKVNGPRSILAIMKSHLGLKKIIL